MALPEYKNLELTLEAGILVATISRPEALNALNAETLESLTGLIAFAETDATVRVLILTGKGEKAFVAGADIKGFSTMNAGDAAIFARKGQEIFTRLERMQKPVIAAVNGFALGGGLELALACDMIVASEKAKFALPECKLGLIPGFGGTVRLPRSVGTAKALEMAMTGNMVTAQEALACGLAVKVVPHGEAVKASLELAQAMVARAPIAIGYIKRSIYQGQEQSVQGAQALEAALFGEVFRTSDKNEGVAAFIEGREPKFTGA